MAMELGAVPPKVRHGLGAGDRYAVGRRGLEGGVKVRRR